MTVYIYTPEQHAQIANTLDVLSTAYLCQAAHHVKKDQHAFDDACPVRQRHVETLAMLKAMQPVSSVGEVVTNVGPRLYKLEDRSNWGMLLYTPTKD